MAYGLVLMLMLMSGCSKDLASCLVFDEKGHGDIQLSAGPWGQVATVNMSGPSRYERIPAEMTYNPCRQSMEVTPDGS